MERESESAHVADAMSALRITERRILFLAFERER
jgi:hypothetical protein